MNVTAYNAFGVSEGSIRERITSGIPVIESANCSVSPVETGHSVSLNAIIDWDGGGNGSVVWQINGHNITGNTYNFSSPGIYTLRVIASNSYGTDAISFNLTVTSSSHNNAILPPTDYSYTIYGLSAAVVVLGAALAYAVLKKRK